MAISISAHFINNICYRGISLFTAIKARIHLRQKLRIMISGATEHHRIDLPQMRFGFIKRVDPPLMPTKTSPSRSLRR